MKLRTVLFILSLLTFISLFIGGYLYYSYIMESVLKESLRHADFQASRMKNRISSFLSENQKASESFAAIEQTGTVLSDRKEHTLQRADAVLDICKASFDADVCYLIGRDGTTIASSNRNDKDSFVGKNYAFRPYFQQAIRGIPAIYMAMGITSDKRGVYYSHPVYGEPRESVAGVLVIKSDIAPLEKEFGQVHEGIVLLTSPDGVIFASNKADWLFHLLWKTSTRDISRIAESRQFGSGPWEHTGLKRTDESHAEDDIGNRYLLYDIKIDHYPGWSLNYLVNLTGISKNFFGTFVERIGSLIIVLYLLIGISVLFLYRFASLDIIRRKIAEKALTDSEEKLRHAKDAAESANRAKSEFLANMSHEIRTPMNAILGFAEILLGKVCDEQQKQYLKTILSSGETLMALINDILDLSKIEAGKMELEYESVNLRRVLNEISQMFQQRVRSKGIGLQTEIADTVPQRLMMDEIRIRQILINLIGNAVKFTSEGYVKISAKCEEAQRSRGTEAQRHKGAEGQRHRETEAQSGAEELCAFVPLPLCTLYFEIEDTGIGIPEDQQSVIFESFRQQDGQSTRKYGGTGLGLTITRRLTEMMNGAISVYSEVGKGSVFQIRFQNIEIADHSEQHEECFPNEDAVDFEAAELMIVDDIQSNRDLIRGYLEYSRIRFAEADSGEKALHILDYQIPDLILMDIRMPGMDGYETTRIIKNHPGMTRIPVIALTASVMKDVEEKIKPLFDGYLRKPVSRSLLIEELKKFLPYNSEVRKKECVQDPGNKQHISGGQSSEMIQTLSALLPEWEEISDTFFIDDVLAFADKIRDIAQKYDFGKLRDYGAALYDAAQSNNFNDMEKLMSEFPDISTHP